MLSIQDVIDYCDLDCCGIEAIAEHEHIPLTVAAEMSESLVRTPEGVCRLHMMFLENIQHSFDCGRIAHAQELAEAYQQLQRSYPLPTH